MSWKKYFTPVPTGNNPTGAYSPFSQRGGNTGVGPAASIVLNVTINTTQWIVILK